MNSLQMSVVKDSHFSKITTKSGKDGIFFKNYHCGLRRTNKNGDEVWTCTHKLCNASIIIREGSITKTTSKKEDGSHELEHEQNMSLNMYECINSIKRRIADTYSYIIESTVFYFSITLHLELVLLRMHLFV